MNSSHVKMASGLLLVAAMPGEVSAMYAVRPAYGKTGKIVRAKDGTSSIRGTADKGTEGIKAFLCRFDSQGGFIDVMALTSDGE